MEVRDSRRLTGPNILTRRAGAILDIGVDTREEAERATRLWRRQAERILEAVGWADQELATRHFHGGLSLWLGAPVDALYAATEVNEWAWQAVESMLRQEGEAEPSTAELADAAARLRGVIAEERNPRVLELQQAARDHGIAFLWDDDEVSVGMGRSSRTWPAKAIADPSHIHWPELSDIPLALITGTNGKTTTVRLLQAMVEAAGKTAGLSSTDGCWVQGEEIGEGDYSGPGGARRVLRDRRVDIGLLETARGGMLRRGLGVERADVALITNVAEDHLGEWGIYDLGELVDTKLIVSQAAEHLVLNADDANLRQRAEDLVQPITWFSLMEGDADKFVARHVEAGGTACVLEGDQLTWLDGSETTPWIGVGDVPMTFGGAARHNVSNALAASAVARHLGLDDTAIRQGLRDFDGSDASNPGRLNRFDFGDAASPTVAVVDFAHNPHGLAALLDMAQAMPAQRRCVLVGQAGDRDDEAIRELPRLVWSYRPDRIILKELRDHLRGRSPGEVTALMADELHRLGAPETVIGRAPSEIDAVRQALTWCREGDLLLLISHAQRDEVLHLLRHLRDNQWRPGEAFPTGI